MTFESEGLLIVAIYIWLPPASYVVFSDNSGCFGCHWFADTLILTTGLEINKDDFVCP